MIIINIQVKSLTIGLNKTVGKVNSNVISTAIGTTQQQE